MKFTYLNDHFDDSFKEINGLTWLPWVGDKYASSENGSRLLLLGESAYDWSHEPGKNPAEVAARLAQATFTREMVEHSHGMKPKSKQKFYRNLERALILRKRPHEDITKLLWRSVCFHNLILDPMHNQKARPCGEQYSSGWQVFYRLVKVLEPKMCLVAGTGNHVVSSCIELAKQNGYEVKKRIWREKVGRPRATLIDVGLNHQSHLSIMFMKHPSKYFSWKRWGNYLSEKVPEFSASFREALDNPAP